MSEKGSKKKGFFSRLMQKLDSGLEKKSKRCCCCSEKKDKDK